MWRARSSRSLIAKGEPYEDKQLYPYVMGDGIRIGRGSDDETESSDRKRMRIQFRRTLRLALLVLLAAPMAAAGVGAILGPLVLHPFHHAVTARRVAHAEQVFSSLGAKKEDFQVQAPDGVVLRGWKVQPQQPNGRWVLLLHGRSHNRSSRVVFAEFLLRAGYSVVMMDARAHGESGGAFATYGYLERRDSVAIVDALESSEKPAHIFALGESMGAAVAVQSAAIDPRIEAVVAEGTFQNLHEVMYDYAGFQGCVLLGKTLFRPAAMVAEFEAEKEGGFRFGDVSPERSITERKFPILLIYGLSDHKIPLRHSQSIYEAAIGPKELWLVPGASHTKAIAAEPEEFRRRVLAFYASASAAN